MNDFFSPAARRDPFAVLAGLRAVAPVQRDPRTGLWLLLDHAGVRRALTDAESFSSAAAPHGTRTSQWLIFSDPPRHTKLRALVSRAFTTHVVASLEPRIAALVKDLVARVGPRGELDVTADLAVPLPLQVIAELLGAPAEDWPLFRRWGGAILGLAHTVAGDPRAAAAAAAFLATHEEMAAYLSPLLDERRAAPREDLLGRLMVAEVDGARLDEEEILAFFQLLLLAGHETTTNLIGNAVVCLDESPDQRALLLERPELWPSAIEEVLRYRSPVQAAFRRTTREVELGSHRLPAGALVLAMIGAANRDPAVVDDPDRFDVTRRPNPHLAFGHGIHFCVGAPLARLEARVALPMLYELLPQLQVAGDWEPQTAFNVHGPARLPVRFNARARRPA